MDISIAVSYFMFILVILWSFLIGFITIIFVPTLLMLLIGFSLSKKMNKKKKRKILISSFFVLLVIEIVLIYIFRDFIISGA